MPPKRRSNKVFRLVSLSDDSVIPLHLGTQTLGRASLPTIDKRVSRDHFQITVQHTGVRISRSGRNPMQVIREDEKVLVKEGYLFALEVGDTICFLPKEHHYVLKETEEDVAPEAKKRKHGDEAEVDVKPPAAKKPHLTEQQKKQEEEDMKLALSLQPRECTLCLENIDVDFLQSLQCGHEFCRDCLVEYFKVNIESRELPLTCPELDCRKQVSDNDLQLLIPPELFQKYEKFTLTDLIEKNSKDYSCCPTPNCDYLFFYIPGDSDFLCPKCKKRYCLNCKVEYHKGSTCKEYEQWSIDNGLADTKFEEFVLGRNCKQCPGCKKWVEKNEGCDHISCRCGEEFCYRCGLPLPCPSEEDDRDDEGSEDW